MAERVALEVRDDGPGFPNEVLLRAGEPYVTTRAPGRNRPADSAGAGLGLGLFIAKTLIERSGALPGERTLLYRARRPNDLNILATLADPPPPRPE